MQLGPRLAQRVWRPIAECNGHGCLDQSRLGGVNVEPFWIAQSSGPAFLFEKKKWPKLNHYMA